MKKLIVGVLVTLMLMLSFGCSSEEIKAPSAVTPDTQDTPAEQPAESTPDPEPEPEPEAPELTIEETELYNANSIVVTATKIEVDDWGDTVLSVTVKNGTSKNIVVTTEELSVNGYMMEVSDLYCAVAAGKNAKEDITFYGSELAEAGIETVADVEFKLRAFDGDTYVDIDITDLMKISTSAAEGFEQPVDDSGEEIYNANDVRVVCKGLKSDIIWDGAVVFFFENNSGRSVSVYAENVSVNDYMADVSLWCDLRPGTRAVDGMYMYSLSDLDIETIDDIEKIELAIRVVDENTWDDIDTSDPIVLEFAAE